MLLLFWVLLIFILSLVAYAFIIKILGRVKVHTPRYNHSSGNIPIYLKSNKVHTDIVFPLQNDHFDWKEVLHENHTLNPKKNYHWVGIGWGDKGFYLNTPTWADLTFKTAFKAMTYLSSSAMHCTFYPEVKEDMYCKKLLLSETEFNSLIQEVLRGFQLHDGKFVLIEDAPPYGQDDIFYEAHGRYSIFYTCNTWVNQCLKRSKLPAKLWVLFEKDIFRGIHTKRSRKRRSLKRR